MHPRLAAAITAMFADPARPWTLPDLADLCGMSRATFMRQFQDKLGRSALDLLTDLRMSMASLGEGFSPVFLLQGEKPSVHVNRVGGS